MKKIALVLVLVLFQFVLVNAQGRVTPQERAKNLKEKLELTDDQTAKVESIFVDSQKKMQELRKNVGGDRSAIRDSMKTISEQADKKITDILTDAQKEKYAQVKKNYAKQN